MALLGWIWVTTAVCAAVLGWQGVLPLPDAMVWTLALSALITCPGLWSGEDPYLFGWARKERLCLWLGLLLLMPVFYIGWAPTS